MKNTKLIMALTATITAGAVQASTNRPHYMPASITPTRAYSTYLEAMNNYSTTKNEAIVNETKIRENYLSQKYPVYKQYIEALRDTGFRDLEKYKEQEKIIDAARVQFEKEKAAYAQSFVTMERN